MKIFLIAGLGNPGKKFEKTYHNIGFQVLEEFLKNFGKIHNFSPFKLKKELNSLISFGIMNNKKIILAKSQTFMNYSGKAVKKLISSFGIQVSDLLVIHDDIDLPLGKIKIVKNQSSAGHKGVQSIINELKTKNFIRFRVGICPKTGKPKNLKKFVLQKFNKDEKKIIEGIIKKTAQAIEVAIKEGLEKAMTKYNK